MPAGRGARGDQRQRGAHVVGLRETGLRDRPKGRRLQRGLAVAAGGHRLDQADGEPAIAEDRVEVEPSSGSGGGPSGPHGR
jgi:hypothetical protein